MPGYRPTPLIESVPLAQELQVGRVFVKDESARLGLPAFKMLGASWAVYQALRQLAPEKSVRPELESLHALVSLLGPRRLVTATDGNHGRAVARMAQLLNLPAHIVLPSAVDPRAVEAIRSEGAVVDVLDMPYDDAVRRAAEIAEEDANSLLVQDTAWPGYEQIPAWIVDGYSTLFREVERQLLAAEANPAGLVVVPTGVGSLTQAAVTFYRSVEPPAALLAVEPASAACITTSLTKGERVSVPTGSTVMDGLNCGTPSSIAWPFIHSGLDASIGISDEQSRAAAGDLQQANIPAGPCGAASLAAARLALSSDTRRHDLGIDHRSTVVLLSTEGAA